MDQGEGEQELGTFGELDPDPTLGRQQNVRLQNSPMSLVLPLLQVGALRPPES